MPKNTFQYKTTISVNRLAFMETVVRNPYLSKKDLRVLLHLLTHLDSLTYKDISKKNIAEELGMKKADVNEAIDNLILENVIEMGDSGSVRGGYKLLF